MSSDIARGIIAKLRDENKELKLAIRNLTNPNYANSTSCWGLYATLDDKATSCESKRHTKNRRRA